MWTFKVGEGRERKTEGTTTQQRATESCLTSSTLLIIPPLALRLLLIHLWWVLGHYFSRPFPSHQQLFGLPQSSHPIDG